MQSILDLDLAAGLVRNIGLFAAAVLAYTYVRQAWPRLTSRRLRWAVGVVFGLAAIAGMTMPVAFVPGVLVDPRQVMVVLATAFGGPLGGIVATAMTAAFRLWLGGAGAVPGAATVLIAALVTMGLMRSRGRSGGSLRVGDLFVAGGLATLSGLVVASSLLILNRPAVAIGLFTSSAVPLTLVNAFGAALLGGMLLREERRRQVEADLAESQRRFTSLAKQAPGVIYQRVLEPDGTLRYSYVSESIAGLCGIGAAEMMRDSRVLQRLTHADDLGRVLDSIRRSAAEMSLWEEDFRVLRPDGTLRWLHGSSRPHRAADGSVVWDGFLTDITRQKADAEALRQARDELERLSLEDGLTGLPNRRQFDARLAAEWARCGRNGTPLSLMMLDVDRFKQFNDRYGHAAGDDCLRRVAAAVAAGPKRPSDLAARFGGEEFAVVLPETGPAGAAGVAERIRAAVEGLGLPHEGAPEGHVTLSVGVACRTPLPGETPDRLIEAADRALYEAKRAGRNRVAGGDAGEAPAGASDRIVALPTARPAGRR